MMLRLLSLPFVAHLLLLVNALPQRRQARQVPAQALYLMDNQDLNSIHAIRINPDGTLSNEVTVTPTGGLGAAGIAGGSMPQVYSGPDSIYGTGAVRISGNSLFVINPWSNTLSMFSIDPTDPLRLTPVGLPVDTQGHFPNSVAVSARHNMACVTNIGAVSGVSCFRVSDKGLSPISVYPYSLNQTTPPVGLINAPLNPQIGALFLSTAFTEDESALLVPQSGNPLANISDHMLVFPVDSTARTLAEPVSSTPNNTALPFNTMLIPNTTKVWVTDPSIGTVIMDIDPTTHVATTEVSVPVPGSEAFCWSFLSLSSGQVYSTDNLVNRLIEQDLATGEIASIINGTNNAIGMSDIYGSGDKVYALSQGVVADSTEVTVFDVSGGRGKAKVVQNFHVAGFTQKPTRATYSAAKGMVVWPDVAA